MTLPLRIVVRTQTPWETMTPESYRAQKDPKTPSEFIRLGRDLLPAWEAATGLSYFQYRAKLRDTCQAALEATGIPVAVGIQEVDWEGPDEALIPIDDDDILRPSVSTIAERFEDQVNLVVWARITNYLGTDRLENPAYGGQLDTCNWAVRKSFLRRWHLSQREFILARHWTAGGIMATEFGYKKDTSLMGMAKAATQIKWDLPLRGPGVVFLEERHSVYYLHSASISFLCHKVGDKKDLVGYLKTLPLHPLYDVPC